VIELSFLSLHHTGRAVVDGVSFSAAPGAVVGIVGPPGAGKTALLRLVAGLARPSTGDALVFGASVVADPAAVAAQVGYLPQDDDFDAESTCDEFLRFYAACFDVPPADRARLSSDLLELVDLLHCRDTLVAALTPGMRRRLGLARALVNNPTVLLLDEPLRGLDPRARVDFRALVGDLCSASKIVLLTAPSPADVADLASAVVHLQAGRITAIGDAASASSRTLIVRFLGDAAVAERIARAAAGVVDVHTHTPDDALSPHRELRITFASSYADAATLLRSLTHSAVQVVEFTH
jgi:ABC-2 type transport system ATP-binding protein